MRSLEHKGAPEKMPSTPAISLVGALLEELTDDLPDEGNLEAVRADLMAASRSYESSKKKDLALRFYLATRSLLREYELLEERMRKAERSLEIQLRAHDRPEVAHEPSAFGMSAGA
jgi:hypothetical protein